MKNFITICTVMGLGLSGYAQTYQNVAAAQNINFINQTLTSWGGGVSFVDFDGDGLDDISLATGLGDSLVFYKNSPTGFTKIPSLVPFTGEAQQVLWVDYDNDGDKDLYVSGNLTSNRLFRNDSGNFVNVTFSAGLSSMVNETYGACWGDFNNDGWLDLYESNQKVFNSPENVLYLSNGAGGFTNVAASAHATDSTLYSFQCVFFDFNNDGLQDIFIANDRQGPTTLLKNRGNNTFLDVSTSANARFLMDGMGVGVGDFDGNGYLDVYITNTTGTAANKLLKNNGNETFTEVAVSMGVTFNSETWGSQFFDYDHDGDLDLHVCDVFTGISQSQTFFENVDTAFIQPPGVFTGDTLRNFSSALGDFNNDGYYDLVSPNHQPSALQLWKSSGVGSNHWIKVLLEGVVSNRDGIGSWIEVYAGSDVYRRYTQCGSGYLGQNSLTTIIGTAAHATVDSVIVRWLSGHVDTFYQLATGQKYILKEGASLQASLRVNGSLFHCFDDTISTGLAAPFGFASYLWSNGDTTASIMATQPGAYYFTLTNSAGLQAFSDTIRIRMDSLMVMAMPCPDTNFAGVGSAEAMAVGGWPPYQFQWDDPQQQTTPKAINLSVGNYRVVVSDSAGCQDSAQVAVGNVVGLEELWLKAFRLYPNPAGEIVKLSLDAALLPALRYGLSIENMVGKEVYRSNWDSSSPLEIEVDRWGAGVYLIRLRHPYTGEYLVQQPLVIQ